MKVVKGSRGCVVCKQPALDELDCGELKVTKNLRAHYYCLLFSETITQSGRDNQGILGFLPSDILSELCRSKQKQCYYCKEFGATAGCVNKFCNIKFHLPCGMKKKTQHNFESFTSYCHKHRKPSNVPARLKRTITNYECVICLESFEAKVDMANVIWADCCKAEILLHLQCMKKLALSAGYFTKCPGCNNKTDFITTIKIRGVFVPERDASWELATNAYSELYYVHNTCDVEKCHCPQGRNFSAERGRWKFILCNLCGSFGTHQFCSYAKKEFVCTVCSLNDENSVITFGSSTSITNSLTSSAKNTKLDEIDNSEDTLTKLESSSVISFESNKNLNAFSRSTNEGTSSPVLHETANSVKIEEIVKNKDYPNKETAEVENKIIDPLDDVIIVDYFDDSSDDNDVNKISKDTAILCHISKEITVKAGAILNKPSTSKFEIQSSHSQTGRRVATKSTTKLPYLKEKSSVLEKATSIEEKTINPLDDVLVDSGSDEDTYDTKELSKISKDFTKIDCIAKDISKGSPDRFKSNSSRHSHNEKRIATKSTTKLPPIKSEINDLENIVKLEKQTINSLDDFDDVIIIDSDDEPSDIDTTELTNIPKDVTMPNPLSNIVIDGIDTTLSVPPLHKLKQESSSCHTERRVALKSTTKLPPLKRKNSDVENTPVEQHPLNKIMKSNNVIVPSIERPTKKFKRSGVAKMSTTHKSTSRLSNLIKKIHTVIGYHSVNDRNSFPLDQSIENDPIVGITHPGSRSDKLIEVLHSEENQPHYRVPLDVDGEIEFVNCPSFSVSAQEIPCQEQ